MSSKAVKSIQKEIKALNEKVLKYHMQQRKADKILEKASAAHTAFQTKTTNKLNEISKLIDKKHAKLLIAKSKESNEEKKKNKKQKDKAKSESSAPNSNRVAMQAYGAPSAVDNVKLHPGV